MTKSSSRPPRRPLWLWGGAFGLVGLALFTTTLFLRAPALITRPLTNPDPNPAALSRFDAELRAETLELLAVGGRARLNGAQATQLLRPWHDRDIEGLTITIEGGRLIFDIAKREGASWINVHLEASDLEVVDGRVRRLEVHSGRVSGWDLTKAWQGRDISEKANRELDDARRRDNRSSRLLATLDVVRFTGTHLEVQTTSPDIRAAFLGTTTHRAKPKE